MVDSNTYEDGTPGYHLRMFQEWNSILGQFEVFGGDEAVYACWKSSHRSARNQTLRNYQVDMAAYAEYARNNDWHRVPFTKFKTWIQLMEGRLERSCTAYEKSTGKKMRIKNIFKAEERARLAELDRIKLSKALWYLLSIDEREEIGFNRHQICQLNTKEIKERISKCNNEVETLIKSLERIGGNSIDGLQREKKIGIFHSILSLEYEGETITVYKREKVLKYIAMLKKQRSKSLLLDGIPAHVAEIMSENEISDAKGIGILRALRKGDMVSKPRNYEAFLQIEKMAMLGQIQLEEALLLVDNSDHDVLISAVYDGKIKMDFANSLLTELNFTNHPQATERIVKGGDITRVAMLFGIVEDNSDEDLEEDKKETKIPPRARRKGRF